YKQNWLENRSFNTKDALFLIENSPVVKSYLAVLELQPKAFETKKDTLLSLLKNSATPIETQREIVFQLHDVPYDDSKEFYQTVTQSKNLKVRQALVQIIEEIPEEFKTDYLKFLDDKSY